MANEADLKLIQIPEFPKTDTLVGSGPEYVVLTKADGVTYGMLTEDFKAFLGTVQVTIPRPISPTDPTPTVPGIYRPTVSGTYPNLGGLVIDNEGKLNEVLFDGGTFLNVVTPLPEVDTSGLATKEQVEELKEVVPTLDDGEPLYSFTDSEGAQVASIKRDGLMDLHPSIETKQRTNYVIETNIPNFIFAILDSENKLLFGLKDDGEIIPKISSTESDTSSYFNLSPYNSEHGQLTLAKTEVLKDFISLPSIAVGRDTAEGSENAPRIPLTTSGYTHPSVFFIGSGWNGFRYWMAITPTFGIIAEQPNPAAFENPHIFCSNDGINWQEPVGIQNPIDLPPASPSLGYWSDTHLMWLPDGYLYCIYRGNGIINSKLGISDNPNDIYNLRADVYRKSKDGINWSEVIFVQGTSNEGVDDLSGILSPAFFYDTGVINCYDVVKSTVLHPYNAENQYSRVVMRRTAGDINDFKNVKYSAANVVNFKNRPWSNNHDVWHLDACKWGNTYFLLINTSLTTTDTGDDLYIAYSGDGWNFTVIPTPVSTGGSYRSCLVPTRFNDSEIEFLVYNNFKPNGNTSLRKITLKYIIS